MDYCQYIAEEIKSKSPYQRREIWLCGTTQDPSPSSSASIDRRREQKRKSKKLALDRAQISLGPVSSLILYPRRSTGILSDACNQISCKWQCEQIIRAHTAYVRVENGVKISLTLTCAIMSCQTVDSHAKILFDWQTWSDKWSLNKFVNHSKDCAGAMCNVNNCKDSKKYSAPAYTPTARALMTNFCDDTNVTAKTVAKLMRSK